MIAAGAWLVLSLVAGIALTRALAPGEEWDETLGTAILFGISIPACALFFMDLADFAWDRVGLVAIVVTITVAAGAFSWWRGVTSKSRASDGVTWISAIATSVLLAFLGGYAVFSVVSIGAENDYIGIWGIKARMFFEAEGVDFAFLKLPANDYVHPDYPILLPLAFDSIAILAGRWDERLFALIYPLAALATILSARAALRREGASTSLTAIGMLAIAPGALSPWVGLGEGPLLAFSTVGLLRARAAIRDGTSLTAASLLLGLGAMVKNEGIAFLVACAFVAFLLAKGRRGRTLRSFWPAVVVILPWNLVRAASGFESYFTRAELAERVVGAFSADRLATVGRLIAQATPIDWWAFFGCGLALAVAGKRVLAERFVLSVTAIQVSFFVGAYLLSPFELDWHVNWSWERLVSQVAFPLEFVLVLGLLRAFEAGAGSDLDDRSVRHPRTG